MGIYRKAKKGEIKCKDCDWCVLPDWCQKRLRCVLSASIKVASLGYAVGKNMTCDSAYRTEQKKKR